MILMYEYKRINMINEQRNTNRLCVSVSSRSPPRARLALGTTVLQRPRSVQVWQQRARAVSQYDQHTYMCDACVCEYVSVLQSQAKFTLMLKV